jgi:hypothetical protein
MSEPNDGVALPDWAIETARVFLARRERSGFPTGQWPEEQLASLLYATRQEGRRDGAALESAAADEAIRQLYASPDVIWQARAWGAREGIEKAAQELERPANCPPSMNEDFSRGWFAAKKAFAFSIRALADPPAKQEER